MAGLGRRSHYRKHLTDSVLNGYPEPSPEDGERIAKVVGTRGSNQFEVILSISRRKSTSSAQAAQQQQQQQQHENQHQQSHEESKASPMINVPSARTPKLAILPTKYRKLVWVKRNDFVIVRCGEDEEEVDEDNVMDHEALYDGDTKVEEAGGGTATATTKSSSTTKSSISKDDVDTDTSTPAVISGIRYEITHILYKDQVSHLRRKGLWPEDDPCFSAEGVGDGSDAAELANESRTKHKGDEAYKQDCEDHNDEGGNDDGIVYAADDLLFVNTNKISTLRVEDSESESESDSIS